MNKDVIVQKLRKKSRELNLNYNVTLSKFHIVGHLLNIQVPFSIDIATGDPVYPLPEFEQYSTLLGDPIEIKLYLWSLYYPRNCKQY